MLGDENRVAAHWCLLAIVFRMSRAEPFPNDAACLYGRFVKPTLIEVGTLLRPEAKPPPERGGQKSSENVVE
jgi:hypothetical protein